MGATAKHTTYICSRRRLLRARDWQKILHGKTRGITSRILVSQNSPPVYRAAILAGLFPFGLLFFFLTRIHCLDPSINGLKYIQDHGVTLYTPQLGPRTRSYGRIASVPTGPGPDIKSRMTINWAPLPCRREPGVRLSQTKKFPTRKAKSKDEFSDTSSKQSADTVPLRTIFGTPDSLISFRKRSKKNLLLELWCLKWDDLN